MVSNRYSLDNPLLKGFWLQRQLKGEISNITSDADIKIAKVQRHTCPWCLGSLDIVLHCMNFL
jgi:hypothetical protein